VPLLLLHAATPGRCVQPETMAALLRLPMASLLLLLPPTVAADSVSSHHAAGTASVTPAPCDGSDPSACPYYWRKPEDTFYRVFINGQESFVYIGEDPPKCTGGYNAQPGHCASHWNVQSQSYTMASAAFSADAPVEVRVLTGHGKLATKPFVDPRAVAGFGKGDPTEMSSSPGEYVFTVASAGHYSIELFGQGAGLRDGGRDGAPAGGGALARQREGEGGRERGQENEEGGCWRGRRGQAGGSAAAQGQAPRPVQLVRLRLVGIGQLRQRQRGSGFDD